jgi:hypothetical protein
MRSNYSPTLERLALVGRPIKHLEGYSDPVISGFYQRIPIFLPICNLTLVKKLLISSEKNGGFHNYHLLLIWTIPSVYGIMCAEPSFFTKVLHT